MKTKTILTLIGIILFINSAYTQNRRGGGFGNCRGNCAYYQTGEEKAITGTISEIDLPMVTVKTSSNEEYAIHAGPVKFLYEQKFEIEKGEKAEVKGKIVNKNHMIPQSIKIGSKSITFADNKNSKSNSSNRKCNYRRNWNRNCSFKN